MSLRPRGRILIIEDNEDTRDALRLQLQIAGHDVHVAATGPDGIRVAAGLQPEVVLLDIGLPGLDGYQVAQQLRTADYGPRLIAITGYGQPEDRERARNAGYRALPGQADRCRGVGAFAQVSLGDTALS
jgi:CheY-like chemotaxis protein